MRKGWVIALGVMLAMGLLAGCGSDQSTIDTRPDASATEVPADGTAPGDDELAASEVEAAPTIDGGADADGDDDSADASAGDGLFPDVLDAVARPDSHGTWSFDVTLSSPYDSPQRYADAWRVLGPDGIELGIRELAHDHANEQPFTRSLGGVAIPEGISEVTIEGRDQRNGWGGATVTVALNE